MIKYRGLGYTLDDSMRTYHEFKDLSELKEYIKSKYPEYKYIKIEPYGGPDERIGWENTYIILGKEENKRYYPCGFVCLVCKECGEHELYSD
jgi:hypothetical protein